MIMPTNGDKHVLRGAGFGYVSVGIEGRENTCKTSFMAQISDGDGDGDGDRHIWGKDFIGTRAV